MSKTKSKKPAEPVADGMTSREAEHYREIRDLERTCDRLEGEYEAAKSGAAAAKSLWSEAVSRLRECIRRGPDPQMALPMDDAPPYMQTEIGAVLTLTDRQAEILENAVVLNVQDFEYLRAGKIADLPGGITDLPGIGQSTADRWEDEVLDWIGRQEQSKHQEEFEEDENEGGDE